VEIQPELRVAIIGLGVGERHISGYESEPRCKVTILCDIDSCKLQELGKQYPNKLLSTNPNEVLQDPNIDVVSIASYDNVHCDQVVTALRHNKHVFVEKPLCLTFTEFNCIVDTLAVYPHLQLSSNLILRKAPRFLTLRQRISKGELGEIYYLEGDYDYGRIDKILNGWRGKIPFYSVVCGGAIHLIDLLIWLTGKRIERVFAWGNKIATAKTKFLYYDFVVSLIEFSDGSIAKVSANFGCVTPHHHRVCIYGTEGTFIQTHSVALYMNSRHLDAPKEVLSDNYPSMSKGDMIPSFVRSILDGTRLEITCKEVLTSMAVALTIDQSLVSGKPESVNYDWEKKIKHD
jgi:predicted dehydrogenase